MKYLTDRRDGKPLQAVNAEIGGGLDLGDLAERLKAVRAATQIWLGPENSKED